MATIGNDVQPTQLAAGDLDGDGVTDLLVGSVQGQIVELLSSANSLLVTAPSVALTGGTRWATTGDFDGDGNADIAVSQFSNEVGVRVLFGDGRGAFPPQQLYDFGQSPGPLVTGDLNGDGRSDLIVGGTERRFRGARLGREDGTLGVLNSVAVTATVVAMAVLDANEDGRMDLAAPGLGMDSPELFLGKGDGTFQPPVTIAGPAPSPSRPPISMVMAIWIWQRPTTTPAVCYSATDMDTSRRPRPFPTATTRSAWRPAIPTVMGAPS